MDTFVFAATEVSDNRVIGFEDWDRVELRHFGYADVDEALARFSQDGKDVLFLDGSVRIMFENAALSQFDAATVLIL